MYGESGQSIVSGGEIVLSTGEAECGSRPCRVTLKQFRVELQPIELDTTEGRFTLEDLVLSLDTPLELSADGTDYVLPTGSRVHSCMKIDGRGDGSTALVDEPARFHASFVDQIFDFEGTLPFVFQLEGDRCQPFPSHVAGRIGSVSPWAAAPSP